MSRFGFSVQKKIWLEVGGKVNDETECKLCDRVGWRKKGSWIDWRKKGSWIDYHDLTFTLQAPDGHLPSCWCFGYLTEAMFSVRNLMIICEVSPSLSSLSSLASRTVSCNL
jgi:serine/threonine-protein kinase